MKNKLFQILFISIFLSCNTTINDKESYPLFSKKINITEYIPSSNDIIINRSVYKDKLEGFWLGQCIANWTGLITEMDKIGNIGDIKTGDFYTRDDWGKKDLPNIWNVENNIIENRLIDFVFRYPDETWGSDDDTDIEYMYQTLLIDNDVSFLNADQIRNGWLKHIKLEEENYLWVSNQKALDLMVEGVLPPQTSDPDLNSHFEMIDAQLTTEIFGLFSPSREDIALRMSYLPIRTTARDNAAWISEFYVIMHSLSSKVDNNLKHNQQLQWMSEKAREVLPETSYAAKMYDFVKEKYNSNIPWEQTRDSVYYRYQVNQKDGYDITARSLNCNGCFAAGINFASSLVSLFYGEGDLKETIKIGVLSGWDSDNPTSTWGGLIGFMNGRKEIERIFNTSFSNKYNIHRTRQNFSNNGVDTFENMSQQGLFIIDKIVLEEMKGGIDLKKNLWYIPRN